MRSLRATLFCTACVIAAPALAGEEVLYAPAPEWVDQAALGEVIASSRASDLLWDWQYRLEDGVVHAYTDRAVRIDNPQMQMEQNQLTLSWLPDKGDLIVHRLEIHRAGEVIDLLGSGAKFDVLRREMGLEQRLLDGKLTATLSVPGLRVGDVLRIAHSVSTDDQALGDEVQALQYLYSEPWLVGSARAVVSWPEDEEIYWRVEDRVPLEAPVSRGGYKFLILDLPLAEPAPVPADAPYRFRRPPVLRVGSFGDWAELSAIMAPHYRQAATLAEGSQVALQARSIAEGTDDALERVALAVQLVQEEVSYLLDGLDGGNYLPQSADQTWDVRYGDCKAKTVLLLAILQEMGIDAEPVLVSTQAGDAVPELLPLPAAFDHVIVHAEIDGVDYWLDGTMNGTRLATLSDVPAFHHALPIRAGGAELVPMTPRDPAVPQMVTTMTLDHTAGFDFPVLFEMEMRVEGPRGAPLRAMVDEDNPALLRDLAQRFTATEGAMLVSDFSIEYDEEKAIALMHVEGVAPASFEWRDGRLRTEAEEIVEGGDFNPDRARPAWRDIPVATPGPMRQRVELTTLLPGDGEGFSLEGEPDFASGYGNMRVMRRASIEDSALRVVNEVVMLPGEIPAAELSEARREARRLTGETLELIPPQQATWRWELEVEDRQRRAAPILAAYDAAVEFADEDDFGPLQARALFNVEIFDFAAARGDFDRLIEDRPSAWAYLQRGMMHQALGDSVAAIEDVRAAWDLDPANGIALELVQMLAYDGQLEDAEHVLDLLPVSAEDHHTYTDRLATVSGLGGDVQSGLSLIAEQVDQSPQNPTILNSDCWYRGLFNVAMADALDRCTQAVERAQHPATALDSRALVRFRQGNLAGALSDLDAALALAPSLAPSRYLRGIVRLSAGDEAGREDIATALRMMPQLPAIYGRHGINPPS